MANPAGAAGACRGAAASLTSTTCLTRRNRMDAQQFDQLAKSFAHGASRRRLMQGLVGGVAAAVVAQARMRSAGAQCNWSGTFQTTLGGITMTLTEAGGQVSGTYTFTQDNAV